MSFNQGYALVVGVGTHKYSPENDVPVTVRDAESVEAILADPATCGYPARQVLSLYKDKATKSGILSRLDDLAAKVTDDSTILVFFAGHGALGPDSQYYLVAHDAQFVDGNDELLVKPGTGVSQVELLHKLRAIKAKRMILIFNACHSGSLQPKSLALHKARKPLNTLNLPEPTAAALLGTGEGRIIITACRPDQLSHYVEKNKLTYFTKALTDGLSGKAPPSKGFISAFSLYNYVYDAVTEMVSEQEPMITVLRGVGPFAVALYQKKAAALGLQAADTLSKGRGVRTLTRRESQKWLTKIENQTIVRGDYIKGDKVMRDKIGKQINTGGGAYVGGNVTAGHDFVGRDRIVHGDEIHGNSISGDSIDVGDVSGTGIAIGRGAQVTVTTGISGQELQRLFEPLMKAIRAMPIATQSDASNKAEELKQEVAKGKAADDSKMGRLIDGLIGLFPSAVSGIVSIFASPILGGIAGPVTKYVLEKIQGK